jgi:hypothetical protein
MGFFTFQKEFAILLNFGAGLIGKRENHALIIESTFK